MMVSDAAGNVFVACYIGVVYEHNLGGGSDWTQVGASVSSMVSDSTGNIYVLCYGGTVYEQMLGSPGNWWTQVGASVSSMVSDATGNVFVACWNGVVYEQVLGSPGNWNKVGSDVSSMVSDATGNVFVVCYDSPVYEHNLGGGADWTQVNWGVSSMVSDATGNVFVTCYNGVVYEQTLGSPGNWNQVGASVSSMVSDATGNVFVACSNGIVYEQVLGSPGNWNQVGASVSKMVSDATGNVFVSCTNGIVYEQILGSPGGWNQVGASVTSMVSDATGNVFVLCKGGVVYEQVLASPGGWTQVNSGISRLVADATGNVFAVSAANGTVAEHTQGGGASWTLMGTGTAQPHADADYSAVSGPLFGPHGPSYLDVCQGDEGDCWLLASLAEVAARDPKTISSMFTYDGTAMENGSLVRIYAVRFYNSSGVARYVTVDTELPAGGGMFDHPVNGVLWVALVEKAYVEANALGYVGTGHEYNDFYNALNGGDPGWALQAITGKPASFYSLNPSNIAAAWKQGKLIVLGTPGNPPNSKIVGDHCYAVVGYNPASSQPFKVFNPWGGTTASPWCIQSGQVYGLFSANATFLAQNFNYESVAAGTAVGRNDDPSASVEAADLLFALEWAPGGHRARR
jgi:hypothetical protein